MQEYNIQTTAVVKYDNGGIEQTDIVQLQVIKNQMVNNNKGRSQGYDFMIFVNNQKRQSCKDMKMHFYPAFTLLYHNYRKA